MADRPPPPPPPHERTSAHGNGTLYTPESLRQWRLARQQKWQQPNGESGSTPTAPRGGHKDTAVGVVAIAAPSSENPLPPSMSLDVPIRRPASATEPRDALLSLPIRTPSQCSAHRTAPYARVSPLALKLHERRGWTAESSAWAASHTTAANSETAFHQAAHELPCSSAHPQQPQILGQLAPLPIAAPAGEEIVATLGGAKQEGDSRRDGQEPPRFPHTLDPRDARPSPCEVVVAASAQSAALTCRVGWCSQPPKRHGLCWTHGGEKKCCRAGCGRAASHGEFCDAHYAHLRR